MLFEFDTMHIIANYIKYTYLIKSDFLCISCSNTHFSLRSKPLMKFTLSLSG